MNAGEVRENQGIFQKAVDASNGTTQDARTREITGQVSDRLADELVKGINGLGLPARRARGIGCGGS